MKTPLEELLQWVRYHMPMDIDVCLLLEAKIKDLIKKECKK
jgi:hypothetical protein